MGPRLTLLSESPACGDENYIETEVGVSAVLRSIATARSRANLYLGDGDTFLQTFILGVEPPAFIFEKGTDPKTNERVLSTVEMTLVTTDRSVPVQFAVTKAALARVDGVEAFRAPLPQRLLRLQRRDFYRLPGHAINSLVRCQVVPGDEPAKIVRPAVFDLSCGGMAIEIPTAVAVLPDGSRHTCTLDFPGLGSIDTPFYVCSSRKITLPGKVPGRRYGIEFLNLEVKGVALIQRFINDEERRLIRAGRR
jgi:c-di-GMP-binding flagellar brake protein YcgR